MASVDGLVTGLDTTSIISQLMQLEAAPQTRLKSQVSAQQTVQSAYQAVNARMVAVRNAAQTLTTATTWQAVTATSSSDAVTASAGVTGQSGTVTFDVAALATTHEVADAVNNANLGLRATVLSTSGGQILQFSAKSTGAAGAFTVGGLTSSTTVLTTGVNAVINVGNPAAGGYQMTSADNTFTGLIPGVTLRANRVQTGVTVSSSPDIGRLADAMQTLVSSVNAASAQISGSSAYNATTKTSGPLGGDALTRGLRANLLSTISGGVGAPGNQTSLSTVGVQLDRTGTLVFDRQKFVAAYQADPASVKALVSGGIATTYQTIATGATDATSGQLTLAVQGVDSSVRKMTSEISDWDVRLAAKKVSLQRRYADLETALGKLKDQSSWLAGQLANLSSG